MNPGKTTEAPRMSTTTLISNGNDKKAVDLYGAVSEQAYDSVIGMIIPQSRVLIQTVRFEYDVPYLAEFLKRMKKVEFTRNEIAAAIKKFFREQVMPANAHFRNLKFEEKTSLGKVNKLSVLIEVFTDPIPLAPPAQEE
jgi:hypothetical protein